MVVVNSEPEFLHDAFLTSMNSRVHEGVLDGGAQSFVDTDSSREELQEEQD